jgi:hypothetical protein
MLEWLEEFLRQATQNVQVDIELVYFNSSSSKILMNFFDLLEDTAQRGIQISVTWKYNEDNDIALECGEEFQEDLEHVAFDLVQVD